MCVCGQATSVGAWHALPFLLFGNDLLYWNVEGGGSCKGRVAAPSTHTTAYCREALLGGWLLSMSLNLPRRGWDGGSSWEWRSAFPAVVLFNVFSFYGSCGIYLAYWTCSSGSGLRKVGLHRDFACLLVVF